MPGARGVWLTAAATDEGAGGTGGGTTAAAEGGAGCVAEAGAAKAAGVGVAGLAGTLVGADTGALVEATSVAATGTEIVGMDVRCCGAGALESICADPATTAWPDSPIGAWAGLTETVALGRAGGCGKGAGSCAGSTAGAEAGIVDGVDGPVAAIAGAGPDAAIEGADGMAETASGIAAAGLVGKGTGTSAAAPFARADNGNAGAAGTGAVGAGNCVSTITRCGAGPPTFTCNCSVVPGGKFCGNRTLRTMSPILSAVSPSGVLPSTSASNTCPALNGAPPAEADGRTVGCGWIAGNIARPCRIRVNAR